MKFLVFTIYFLPSVLIGQIKSGEIIYKEVTKLNIPDEYKYMIPEGMADTVVNDKILLFNEKRSLNKSYENLDDDSSESTSTGGAVVMIGGTGDSNDEEIYTDLEENVQIEKRSFQGKQFLIVDDVMKMDGWKINPESFDFMGYKCMKAIRVNDSIETEAWFTTDIPVSFGPSNFGGLPGIILRAEVKSEEFGMKIIATSVKEKKSKMISKPKGGQKTTREEYQKIMEKKIQEMKDMYGGSEGGNTIIIGG